MILRERRIEVPKKFQNFRNTHLLRKAIALFQRIYCARFEKRTVNLLCSQRRRRFSNCRLLRCEAKQNGEDHVTRWKMPVAGREPWRFSRQSMHAMARREPTASASLPRRGNVVQKLSAPYEFQAETCPGSFPSSRFWRRKR